MPRILSKCSLLSSSEESPFSSMDFATHATAPVWALPLPPPSVSTRTTTADPSRSRPSTEPFHASLLGFGNEGAAAVSSKASVPTALLMASAPHESASELEGALERVHEAGASLRMEMNTEREALSAEGSRQRASLAATRGRLVEVERRRAAQLVLVEEKVEHLNREGSEARSEKERLLASLLDAKRAAAEMPAAFAAEARSASEAAAYREELEAQSSAISEAQQELLEVQRGSTAKAGSHKIGLTSDGRAAHMRQRAEHESRALRSELVSVRRQLEAMRAGFDAREFHCELLGDEVSAARADLVAMQPGRSEAHSYQGGVNDTHVISELDLQLHATHVASSMHYAHTATSSTSEAVQLKAANAELRLELGATEAEAAAKEAALQLRKAELTADTFSLAAVVNDPLTAADPCKQLSMCPRMASSVPSHPSSSSSATAMATDSTTSSCVTLRTKEREAALAQRITTPSPPPQRRIASTPDDPCLTGSPLSRWTPLELSVLGNTLDLSTSSASSLPQRYFDQARTDPDIFGGKSLMQSHSSGESCLKADCTLSPPRVENQLSCSLEARGIHQKHGKLDDILGDKGETLTSHGCHEVVGSVSCTQEHHSATAASPPSSSPSLSADGAAGRLQQPFSNVQEPQSALGSMSTIPALDSLGGSRTPITAFERRPVWANNNSTDVVLSSLSGDSENCERECNVLSKGAWIKAEAEIAAMHQHALQRTTQFQQELSEAMNLQRQSAALARSEAQALRHCQMQFDAETQACLEVEAQKSAAEATLRANATREVAHLEQVIAELKSAAKEEESQVQRMNHDLQERLACSRWSATDEARQANACRSQLEASHQKVSSISAELAAERLLTKALRQAERDERRKAEREARASENLSARNSVLEETCCQLKEEFAAAVNRCRGEQSFASQSREAHRQELKEPLRSEGQDFRTSLGAARATKARFIEREVRGILNSASSSRSSLGDMPASASLGSTAHAVTPNGVDFASASSSTRRLRQGAFSRSSSEEEGAFFSQVPLLHTGRVEQEQNLRSHAADLKRRLAHRVGEVAAARQLQSQAGTRASHAGFNKKLGEVPPEVVAAPESRRASSIPSGSSGVSLTTAWRARLHAGRPRSNGPRSPPSSPDSSLERLVMKANPLLQQHRGAR